MSPLDGRKYPNELEPDDIIVFYEHPETGECKFFRSYSATPAMWLRKTARIVETCEMEDTASESSHEVQEDGTLAYRLGEPNRWMVRFFVGDKRYTMRDVSARFFFEVLPLHHPVCIECVEPWPCREHRIDGEAMRLTRALDDACSHCGEPIGGAWSTSFFDGGVRRRYHLAKKYRGPDGRMCKRAAEDAQASASHLSDLEEPQ